MNPVTDQKNQLFPASWQQEEVWLHTLQVGSAYWNFVEIKVYEGELNTEMLNKAITQIMARHSSLRASFVRQNDKLYQCVKPEVKASNFVKHQVLQEVESDNIMDSVVHKAIAEEEKYAFDLERELLVRLRVISCGEKHCLILTMNHIITDATSMQIFWNELSKTYNHLLLEKTPIALPRADQYIDYSNHQHEFRKSEKWENQHQYWSDKLISVRQDVHFNYYPRNANASIYYEEIELSGELVEAIRTFSFRKRVIYSSLFQLAYFVLLYRYSGQSDIAIGNSYNGRGFGKQNHGSVIGLFANRLINTLSIERNDSLIDLLQKVNQDLITSFKHSDISLEEIIRGLNAKNGAGYVPEFVAGFNMIKAGANSLELVGLKATNKNYKNNTVGNILTDIGLTVIDSSISTVIRLELKCDQTFKPILPWMTQSYLNILEECVYHIDKQVSELNELTLAERDFLNAFNQTSQPEFKRSTLVELFVEQVYEKPYSIALIIENKEVTYQDLDKMSNQLAHYITSIGLMPNDMAAICMERSVEMIVSILAIMKVGAAYVPIDPDYPQDRIDYILDDTGINFVLSNENKSSTLSLSHAIDIVLVDKEWNDIKKFPETYSYNNLDHNNLAYIIYTSGSTGTPKGVMIRHKNVVNTILAHIKEWEMQPTDRMLQFASLSFDASVNEIFIALCSGIPLVLARKSDILDKSRFVSLLKEQQITLAILTPAYLKMLSNQDLENIRVLTTAGESAEVRQLTSLSRQMTCYNGYGPTECSICASMYKIQPEDDNRERLPIGKPIANTSILIYDQNGNHAPIGVPGEIVIQGEGVGAGYWKSERLTSERFINSSSTTTFKGYKTGDIGRWLPDGTVEFLGRKDDQVKLRGFRVDLNEIEIVGKNTGLVENFVTIINHEGELEKQLIGGIMINSDDFELRPFIDCLTEKLPHYMVPALWIIQREFPLTSNGKVDKEALSKLPRITLKNEDQAAARNDMEDYLVGVWQELLELDQVGIHDDFFNLGGHSLLAISLVSTIQNSLDYEVGIEDVFDYPTIARLSERLTQLTSNASQLTIQPVNDDEVVPLSFQQEALWFLDQLQGSTHYHIPKVFKTNDELDIELLTLAIRRLITRHQPLRTICHQENGRAHLKVKEADSWNLEVRECKDYSMAELQLLVTELLERPFDLGRDFMLKVILLKVNESETVLVMNLHHIAFDGWSWGIFYDELNQLYSNHAEANLEALPISYRAFSFWNHLYMEEPKMKEKLLFWENTLKGSEPLNLPTDFSRPESQSTQGASVYFEFDQPLAEQLRSFSAENDVTLHMTFLAGLSVLLHKYTSQNDFCVGLPISGRHYHTDLEKLVGFFSSTIVFRSNLETGITFLELLKRTKHTLVEAYAHQDVPFEKVVDAVSSKRDISKNPLFQVMLVMQQPMVSDNLKLGDVSFEEMSSGLSMSKFDLNISIIDSPTTLGCNIEYCKDLFLDSTIERMSANFRQLLSSIVERPGQIIGDINVLSNAEWDMLTSTLNDSAQDYPDDKTIIDLIAYNVEHSPQRKAVKCGSNEISYERLWHLSGYVCQLLWDKGLQQEEPVALCIDRSVEMIVGIVGILRAGCAYVPIDPEYPDDRISFIISDIGAKVVLINKITEISLPQEYQGDVIVLDNILTTADIKDVAPVSINTTQLAYVMYTSGSTGKPKGVMIEHRNVVSLLFGFQHIAGEATGSDGLSLCPYVFDVSVWEIFTNLCFGNTLHLLQENEMADPEDIARYVVNHEIENAYFPPTILNEIAYEMEILDKQSSLCRLLVGVMSIPQETLQRYKIMIPDLTIINGYGPTESTICTTFFQFEKAENVHKYTPIGGPASNNKVFLLDRANKLVPIGAYGEISVAGNGVGRGYWNNEKLTGDQFLPCPYVENGGLMYKTGDLGRWLESGVIEYMGRFDDQVKINGYRIELKEIEARLKGSNMVEKVAVIVAGNHTNSQRLVGYAIPKLKDLVYQDIIQYLRTSIPEYMVPKQWVLLKEFPFTANGKIDKQALLEKINEVKVSSYVDPSTDTEKRLVLIWQDLLSSNRIGVNDDFFVLGGNSLLSIQLASRIKEEFELVIKVKLMFQMPTIYDLSQYIDTVTSNRSSEFETRGFQVYEV